MNLNLNLVKRRTNSVVNGSGLDQVEPKYQFIKILQNSHADSYSIKN